VSVLPYIEEEFVSIGQVRVQSRPIATQGEESVLAAQAVECASEQGQFWDFHDTLYANQRGRNEGAFSRDNLKRFAEALGLETVAFDSCLDSGRYASKVRDDTDAAGQMGVNKVPTILVNGREVPWPLETMQAAIREALGPAP
jgi:protein-disulfide isomerase